MVFLCPLVIHMFVGNIKELGFAGSMSRSVVTSYFDYIVLRVVDSYIWQREYDIKMYRVLS